MLALLALLSSPARAGADLEVRAPASVVVSIDGKRAAYTTRFNQRLTDLEPGVHEVRVASVLGKTLHEQAVELPDGTLTVAEWSRGELVIAEVVAAEGVADALPAEATEQPDRAQDAAPAAEAEGGKQAALLAEAPEPDPAAALAVAASGEGGSALEQPMPVEGVEEGFVPEEPSLWEPPYGAVEELALVVEPEPAVPVAKLPGAAELGPERTITVQAPEGVAVEVVHGGRAVRVYAVGGRLFVEDADGVRIELGPASP